MTEKPNPSPYLLRWWSPSFLHHWSPHSSRLFSLCTWPELLDFLQLISHLCTTGLPTVVAKPISCLKSNLHTLFIACECIFSQSCLDFFYDLSPLTLWESYKCMPLCVWVLFWTDLSLGFLSHDHYSQLHPTFSPSFFPNLSPYTLKVRLNNVGDLKKFF